MDYLAGFIDGEGCFYIYRNINRQGCFQFAITIANTDLGILLAIKEKWGGKIYENRKLKKNKTSRKINWRWMVSGREAIALSKDLKDKLIIKRRQAELFSNLIIQRKGGNKKMPLDEYQKRILVFKEIRNLNQIGRETEKNKIYSFDNYKILQNSLPFIQN